MSLSLPESVQREDFSNVQFNNLSAKHPTEKPSTSWNSSHRADFKQDPVTSMGGQFEVTMLSLPFGCIARQHPSPLNINPFWSSTVHAQFRWARVAQSNNWPHKCDKLHFSSMCKWRVRTIYVPGEETFGQRDQLGRGGVDEDDALAHILLLHVPAGHGLDDGFPTP